MELVFSHVAEPNIHAPSGWNGTDIACKQRTGQKNLTLKKEFTVTLPDKVDAKWYALLAGKLSGTPINSFKHSIKVFDRTDFLVEGYKRLQAEQGMNFNLLNVDPTTKDFATRLGRGIITLKHMAKLKLNNF